LDVSCIILAGGKSKRLGRNKVIETIGGLSLVETVINRLQKLNSPIIIVTAHDSVMPALNNFPGIKIIEDIKPGKGTLGGIYTGLFAAPTHYSLAVACDMPFINLDLVKYMIDAAEGFDAVVPRTVRQVLEPLHALYSRSCLEPIESLIDQNRLSVLDLYPLIKVRYIEDSEINRFDPRNISFFNINTEADLTNGRELAEKKGLLND